MKSRFLTRFFHASPFIALVTMVVGCTAIIGNFDVGPTSSTGDGGEGGACTQCGADCVDLATSSAHCGKCETSCTAGQTCQASACKCPMDQAFCASMCVKADRTHCGPSCSQCQNDEICSGMCVTAPPPAFDYKPLEATGWIDAESKPLRFMLKDTGSPGTIYECRTGPDATFTSAVPEWKPCDGAMGTMPTHVPKPDSAAPEGTYRTEYRYRVDTYRSPAISYVYYAHHQLDKAETCPRKGHPEDGPVVTDDEVFAAAQAYSTSNPTKFPLASAFPAPGNPAARTDDIFLRRPWIKIPFKGIVANGHMRVADGFTNSPRWPVDGGDYVLNERNLRHRYAINPGRTMISWSRQYVRPKTETSPMQTCKNLVKTGNKLSAGQYGPDDANRGRHVFDCAALVLNTHGHALCINKDSSGKVAPTVIDHDPHLNGFVLGGMVSYDKATGILTSNGASLSAYLNGYLEIPQNSTWYKIISVVDATHVKISPAPSANIALTTYMVAPRLADVANIPTGYAKLHDESHGSADGLKLPGIPARTTKCEAPGCNTGKPWLTYLPP